MDSILYDRIKELCKRNNITMGKLVDDLGISPSIIRKWKTSSPSVEKIKLVAEYFGVSIDYLTGLSNIPDSADKVVGDKDIISLQRARSKMSDDDKDKMMRMLKLAFEKAFDEDNTGSDI